jgi:hypothetical protein
MRLFSARKKRVVLVVVAFCGAVLVQAAEPWVLLPEPKFMRHKVTRPIPGAKATELAVVRFDGVDPAFPRAEEWEGLGVKDEAVAATTRQKAAEWFQQVSPSFVRDKKKVVEYAVLSSEKVPVAVTVLAPEFRRRFEEVFGPKMRVVIPNRHTAYVFPDVASDLSWYAPMILEAWRGGLPKVSLEVFELSERGLKAIGQFEEP